jgi:hypothetical protein
MYKKFWAEKKRFYIMFSSWASCIYSFSNLSNELSILSDPKSIVCNFCTHLILSKVLLDFLFIIDEITFISLL